MCIVHRTLRDATHTRNVNILTYLSELNTYEVHQIEKNKIYNRSDGIICWSIANHSSC